MARHVIGYVLLALFVSSCLVSIARAKKDDDKEDDDLCKKTKCPKGKRCEVMQYAETNEKVPICVVAGDCDCADGHECVRQGKKTVCVCVADDCLPKGESCGNGQFRCSKYETCVDNDRCCVADCESAFAGYVFKRPEPICAEDGVTYESLCFFNRDRCLRNDFSVFVAFHNLVCREKERRCGPEHTCRADQICAKSHAGFRCCPASCPVPKKPDNLCGDDNHLHLDACHLERTSCIVGHDIQVVEKNLCRQDCELGKKKVKSGETIRLKDGCSQCQCNNGHWHCYHEDCL